MPIYLFVCTKCEHQFDKLVRKMDGLLNPACPQCGAETERGVETVGKFVWGKGGGWS
jgi:putative FmdB family regulatory protein